MSASAPEPGLLGQTVVVIGGSAGIGLETARRARAEGADVVLAGSPPRAPGAATLGTGDKIPTLSGREDRAYGVFDCLPPARS